MRIVLPHTTRLHMMINQCSISSEKGLPGKSEGMQVALAKTLLSNFPLKQSDTTNIRSR